MPMKHKRAHATYTEADRGDTMLLFFDIDGTIFDDKRHLPATVKPAMEAAHRNGHQLVINTGRTLCNMDRRLDDFPLDGWIMGCGTRVIWHGNTIQSMEYGPEESQRLRKLFQDLEMPAVYECDTAMYFDPENDAHPAIDGFREWAAAHGIFREIGDGDPEFRAVKMFTFAGKDRIAEMKKRTAEIGMPYTAINRWPEEWELVPAGYSKGKGIDILRKRIGVGREDCYAFGDSRNDLTMLRHAGHSIAMGNATDDVKKACSYVTDLPEKDGIEKAMKHFRLI